jgi:hypothetical protein
MTVDSFFVNDVLESFEGTLTGKDVGNLILAAEEAENEFEPCLKFRKTINAKMSKVKGSTDEGAKLLLDLVSIGFLYGLLAGASGITNEINSLPLHKRIEGAIKGEFF